MKNINCIPIISDKQFECPFEKPYGYIYKITNQINGHYYIGKHKFSKPYLDKKYKGSGSILKKAYEKYGFDNFEITILEWTDKDNNELNKLEKLYITVFHANELPNYNLTDGGDGGDTLSDIQKQELSSRMSGKNNYFYSHRFIGEAHPMFGTHLSESHKENISKGKKGKSINLHHTEQFKQRMSILHKGKIVSDETRKKMSDNHWDCSGKNHPNFGKGYKFIGSKNGMFGKGYLIQGSKNGMYGKTHSAKSKELMRNKRPSMSGMNNPNFGKKALPKAVEKCDLQWNTLETYTSIGHACKCNKGCYSYGIRKSCNTKQPYHDYFWRWLNA